MLEMASLGSKVLQIRSVGLPAEVQSAFACAVENAPWDIDIQEEAQSGALITYEEDEKWNKPSCRASHSIVTKPKFPYLVSPDTPGIASRILGAVAQANVEVDIIIKHLSRGQNRLWLYGAPATITPRPWTCSKRMCCQPGHGQTGGRYPDLQGGIVGMGMRSHVGIASRMLKL